ncbi:MAG: metallophosphoesterase family protein [Eubacteriales bacterium]|nr:metallophosphoesterase family protein [Eubacteriales bacterium]
MKILAVADVESKYFFEYYTPGKLKDYDLIIACGDLRVSYLEFLVTMARCPLLYVHGNHDDRFPREPEGCVCIDDCLYEYQGLRILGLGGSYRYGQGSYMYTERQMRRRIRRLRFRLWRKKGFDILVTHAPARGINDFDTLSHRGFECFVELLDRYKPRLFLHGHIHRNYGAEIPRRTQRGETEIVNAYEHTVVEL